MKLIACAVYDYKTQAWMPPHWHRHTGEATRAFEAGINEGDSMLSRHPKDFALFSIGVFDDESGELTPHKHEKIVDAEALVRAPSDKASLLDGVRPRNHA